MLEIAVCDDDILIAADIEKMLEKLSLIVAIKVEIDVFYDGSTLVDYIKKGKRYDIIYLDIEMRKQNGVEAARIIRRIDKKVLIIYVTSHESFAKEVFEVSAFRFITKPIVPDVFQSDRRVTYIITKKGNRKCYGKLNDIEKRLNEANTYFYRTHQSFLVNPKFVAAYIYDSMELIDGTTLAISENRRKNVSELYCALKGEDIIV